MTCCSSSSAPSASFRCAVVLSGCGVYDGAEIHEAVLTLLAIARHGGTVQCFAPNRDQMHVVNHLTGAVEDGARRNVLVEAARIARGKIADLADYRAEDFDALVFPGGFGAAKNLCTFAVSGPDCDVDPETARALHQTHAAGKPIVALCIAPALVAKVLAPVAPSLTVTIGNDSGTAQAIKAVGATHQDAVEGAVVVDPVAKVITSPCYMYDATIDQIADSADAAIAALRDLL